MANKFTIKELNEKILFNEKLGIILPFVKENELKETILKDIYKDDFYKEEVSEKIRLFYVALTRCREKMIIVGSFDKNSNKYDKLVPTLERIKYRSFLDILNSVTVIDKYMVDKEANYTHMYDEVRTKDLAGFKSDMVIDKLEVNIEYNTIDNLHFSKETNKLIDIEQAKAMRYGTMVHEKLEFADFEVGEDKTIQQLFKYIDKDYEKIYREFEFTDVKEGNLYHGIIDLMLEYKDYINIVDYKLKNVDDEKYNMQLKGYKDYIQKISNKKVNIYLYSIMDEIVKKLED